MQKEVFLFIEEIKGRKIFRLVENVAGTPMPAADSKIRKGVVDKSEDIAVLANSILEIGKITGDSVTVKFGPPKGFDSSKFFSLSGTDLLVAQEKLGSSPG